MGGLDHCIENFNFMAITEDAGTTKLNEEIDGILGLGAEAATGPNFMESLKASGKIDEAMVSFELGFYNKNPKLASPSSVTFGGYDSSKFDTALNWFNLKTNNWWALDIRKFSYGNTTIS
jgi:hypothetical protein